MSTDSSHPPSDPQHGADASRAAEGAAAEAQQGPAAPSVLETLEERAGSLSRILLRDGDVGDTPVLTVHAKSSAEAATDDVRYQVLGEIGRGGVGIIFQGRDRDLGRDVAMKVLRPEMLEKRHVVERFIEEAQVAGQLQHPGIVPVYGMGLQPDGRPYFAMKLVKGKTLAAILGARSDPTEGRRTLLGVFQRVCETMGYVHSRGVIHRDLKPANIMVGAFDEVQVMDWGFAKVLGQSRDPSPTPVNPGESMIDTVRSGSEGSASVAGSVMGTPAYMPPEQAMGRINVLDERVDVFALGSLLAEILTGKPAYVGSGSALIVQAARGELDACYERLADAHIPRVLAQIAQECLAANPDDRPPNAGSVAESVTVWLEASEARARQGELDQAAAVAAAEAQHTAIERARAQQEAEAAREVQATREAAWAARARRRTAILAALVLVGLLIGGGTYLAHERTRDANDRRTRDAVNGILSEARGHASRGDFAQAERTTKDALLLARGRDAPEATLLSIEAFAADLRDARDTRSARESEAQQDATMVTTLESLGLRGRVGARATPSEVDAIRVDMDYAAAFRNYGLPIDDLAMLDPDEAALKITQRAIRADLVAALDDWAWLRRVERGLDASLWRPLIEIANKADGAGWPREVRAAMLAGDRAALEALASEADIAFLPPRTLAALGRSLQLLQDPITAREFLKEALTLHPGDVWVHHTYAEACASDDEQLLREAHRSHICIAALRPNNVWSWLGLAEVALKRGQTEESEEALWRAAHVAPRDDAPQRMLGWLLAANPKDAIARATRRLGERVRWGAFYEGLASGRQLRQDTAGARKFAKLALRRGPSAAAHVIHARADALDGDITRALASLDTALKIKPGSIPALRERARLEMEHLHDLDRALATLRAAAARIPLPSLLQQQAELLRRGKRYEEALTAARALRDRDPNGRAGWLLIGDIQLRLGREGAARTAYKGLLERRGNDPRAFAEVAMRYLTPRDNRPWDVDRAQAVAMGGIRADPDNRGVRRALTHAAHATGTARASRRADKVLRNFVIDQGDTAALWIWGASVWREISATEHVRAYLREAQEREMSASERLDYVRVLLVSDPVEALDLEAARALLDQVSTELAGQPDLLALRALAALRAEAWDDAKTAARAALNGRPLRPDAIEVLVLATVAHQAKDIAGARAWLRMAETALDRGTVDARRIRAPLLRSTRALLDATSEDR